MQICIKTLTGKTISIDCCASDKISTSNTGCVQWTTEKCATTILYAPPDDATLEALGFGYMLNGYRKIGTDGRDGLVRETYGSDGLDGLTTPEFSDSGIDASLYATTYNGSIVLAAAHRLVAPGCKHGVRAPQRACTDGIKEKICLNEVVACRPDACV